MWAPLCQRHIYVSQKIAARSQTYSSSREKRIAELVSQGLKNREIALELGITVHVVRNYVGSIYDKLGMNNRVELALWYEARQSRGAACEAGSRTNVKRRSLQVPIGPCMLEIT